MEEILKQYVYLQILNQEFNFCFSTWVLPCFLILHIPIVCLCLVFALTFHKVMKWVYFLLFSGFALCSLIGIAIVFPFAGNLYAESNSLKHFLKYNGRQSKLSRASIRAMIPLKVAVRNVGIIRKYTGLAMLGMIVYFTLRVTILLK